MKKGRREEEDRECKGGWIWTASARCESLGVHDLEGSLAGRLGCNVNTVGGSLFFERLHLKTGEVMR